MGVRSGQGQEERQRHIIPSPSMEGDLEGEGEVETR